MTGHLLAVTITIPPTLAEAEADRITAMAQRLGFGIAAEAPDGEVLVEVNDPDEVARVRAEIGPDDDIVVAVPISIGRTRSEAIARADLEPRFAQRHPRDVGIFGTFEEAQEQVLALARAGADGLRLDVPLERDVADVLAQIRALVVGATPLLLDAPEGLERTTPQPTVFYG